MLSVYPGLLVLCVIVIAVGQRFGDQVAPSLGSESFYWVICCLLSAGDSIQEESGIGEGIRGADTSPGQAFCSGGYSFATHLRTSVRSGIDLL